MVLIKVALLRNQPIALADTHLVTLGEDSKVTTLRAQDKDVCQLDLEHVVAIAASGRVSLFLKSDGTVWGTGHRHMLGHSGSVLNEDDQHAILIPRQVPGLSGIRKIVVDGDFCAALDERGQAWGWGMNGNGQLGLPADDFGFKAPHPLPGLSSVKDLAAGQDFLLALTKDGSLLAKGCNVYGVLGDRRQEFCGEQRPITGLGEVERVFAGPHNAFAQLIDGSFVGWGANAPTLGGFHPAADRVGLAPTPLDARARPEPPGDRIKEGGVRVRLYRELDDDILKSEKMEFFLGEASAGTMILDEHHRSAELTFEASAGAHQYRIMGETTTKYSPTSLRFERTGVFVVGPTSLADEIRDSASRLGPKRALEQQQERVEAILPGLTTDMSRSSPNLE